MPFRPSSNPGDRLDEDLASSTPTKPTTIAAAVAPWPAATSKLASPAAALRAAQGLGGIDGWWSARLLGSASFAALQPVTRQYTGSAGKITNCQIGVFAAYVSGKGHAFIDRALYLPKAWTDDAMRRAAAHVPEEVAFATKPQLARAMIERAIAADVPFAWVAADSVYGVGEIEMMLRRQAKGYVLGVSGAHHFNSWIGKPEVGGHGRGDCQGAG
jgi:hypothetical protein